MMRATMKAGKGSEQAIRSSICTEYRDPCSVRPSHPGTQFQPFTIR